MDWLWGWALSIDEEFAYKLYCLWEEMPTLEFTRLLQFLAEYITEDADLIFRKVA